MKSPSLFARSCTAFSLNIEPFGSTTGGLCSFMSLRVTGHINLLWICLELANPSASCWYACSRRYASAIGTVCSIWGYPTGAQQAPAGSTTLVKQRHLRMQRVFNRGSNWVTGCWLQSRKACLQSTYNCLPNACQRRRAIDLRHDREHASKPKAALSKRYWSAWARNIF